jgi:hypothetical protein
MVLALAVPLCGIPLRGIAQKKKPVPQSGTAFAGVAWVMADRKWGLIDGAGHFIVEPKYWLIGDLSEGLAWTAEPDSSVGYLDTAGKSVINGKFEAVGDFSEGLAWAAVCGDNGRFSGYIDKSGAFAITPQFDTALAFSEGMAPVGIDKGSHRRVCAYPPYRGKWGYIDKTGKLVIEMQYAVARAFSGGLAQVIPSFEKTPSGLRPSKILYIDKSGKTVIDGRFDAAMDFAEGLAGVKIDGKWGFIDTKGAPAIKPQFDEVGMFHGGLARAKLDGRWGYINHSGDWAIPAHFAAAVDFDGGLAFAQPDDHGKWGILNPEGRFLVPASRGYDSATGFKNGYGVAAMCAEEPLAAGSGPLAKDSRPAGPTADCQLRYGLIDRTGNFVIPPKYEQIKGYHSVP